MSRAAGPLAPDLIKILMHGPRRLCELVEIVGYSRGDVWGWLENFERSGVVKRLEGKPPRWALCDMPFSETYREGPLE